MSPDGALVRKYTKCLGCESKERHRLMYLWFNHRFSRTGEAGQALLHVAPEKFLRPYFRAHFATYHTCDLFMDGVDFKEDLQALALADASYDVVVVSRVIYSPPNLEACVRELRRVLRMGGVAVIAETYTRAKTVEFGRLVGNGSRELGVDAIDLYRRHFDRVELVTSDQYPGQYQLHNRIVHRGRPKDDYPDLVRLPGLGFKDVLAVCRA